MNAIKEARQRRAAAIEKRDRIVAAIADGAISAEEAAPQLEAVRSTIALEDANIATRPPKPEPAPLTPEETRRLTMEHAAGALNAANCTYPTDMPGYLERCEKVAAHFGVFPEVVWDDTADDWRTVNRVKVVNKDGTLRTQPGVHGTPVEVDSARVISDLLYWDRSFRWRAF